MKTYLVTGGAGFLGSHIADGLIADGHAVAILDDLSGGSRDNVPANAAFYCGDICNEALVNRLCAHNKFAGIIHCAAFASENLSHHCALHTTRSIVQGTTTLINAAVNHGVELFVNMSSIAVYGHGNPPFTEEMVPAPADPYGCAKLCAEGLLAAAHDNFKLNYVTFRPHNIIGTRQSLADQTRNAASIFIRQALSGKAITIFGDGKQTRAWSPVSDVARVIAAFVNSPGAWNKVFNIGGNRVMQVYDLGNIICELAGVEPKFDFLPARNEAKHAHSNHDRLTRHFSGQITFIYEHMEFDPGKQKIVTYDAVEHCLAQMIAEARRRPLPPVQAMPRLEITKGVNPAWMRQP